MSYVYAIENADGLVKIGWSTDPMARLSKINSDTACACRMIGFLPGTREQEAELHELCAAERVHREWYRRGHMVSNFLALMPRRVPAPDRFESRPVDETAHPLRAWRHASGLTLEAAADMLGVRGPMLSRWETGVRPVPPHRVIGIERLTRVHRSILRPDLHPVAEAAQ